MSHRTLNAAASFGLDARESTVPKRRPRHDKGDVEGAWRKEFPSVPLPFYAGSLPREVYPKLQDSGWKFSSQYGWRKKTV